MVKSAFNTTTFWYKFKWNLNSYSQTLTLLFITYTIYPSNVPVLLRSHQLRSLWATLRYQCDHFLQPHRVGCPSKYRKEKQSESKVIYYTAFCIQLRSLWATLQYQCDHFLQPQRAECRKKTRKENNEKV